MPVLPMTARLCATKVETEVATTSPRDIRSSEGNRCHDASPDAAEVQDLEARRRSTDLLCLNSTANRLRNEMIAV